jgi:hypothetical protein
MDCGEERIKLTELDFRNGKVKKVRVVTYLHEKEAGGKAVGREKKRLGLSSKEKLADPFCAILFEKTLSKKKICVLCDFSSYEEARKEEKLENFLHPQKVTDFGVECTGCSHFQCRICLQELDALLLPQHCDFGYL